MGDVVGDILGLTDHAGQRQAAADAAAAQREATKLARENLEWQQEKYDRWKGIYGDIEENLGEYYNALNGDQLVTFGLREQQKAHQQTQKNIAKNLAKRGIGDSKFESYLETGADSANNYARADLRANSEQRANEQKMQFLGVGLGQGSEILHNVNTAANTGVNAYNNQAGTYNDQFSRLAADNSAMLRTLTSEGISAAGDVYNPKPQPAPAPRRYY